MPYATTSFMQQALTCFFGLFAMPTALLTPESMGSIERYGIAGVMGVVAVICFRSWQAVEKDRNNGQRDRIAYLEAEVKRLQSEKQEKHT